MLSENFISVEKTPAARLEFQEYGEGENQESPETDVAMEVIAASVSRLKN